MKNIQFINAGAGSGKTYFLSKKLAKLVSNKECSAEEIILTTFTDIAASELKNKAREALFKAGKPDQANLLSSAAIGTIHSVALQLIQKYWQYLGVGVDLRVMPEEDKNFFLTQSLAFIPTPEELNILDRLTRSFDFRKGIGEQDTDRWKSDLLDIIGKSLNNRMNSLDASRAASLLEQERLFPIDPAWQLNINRISDTLREALRLLKAATQNATNIEKINTAESLINLNGNLGFCDLIALDSFLSKLPAYINKNLPDRDAILQELANINSSPLLVNGIRDYINLIFNLATRSIDRYRGYKQEHKLIDYNDMEVLFLDLLENDGAKIEIANRYKMVFVDEFQDCSPIQIEIFCKLSELVKQSYWVGDPKQAIYDFRGTDPLLIEAIINKLSSDNDENLTIGERLSDSWRSRPQIVDLTNHIFTTALADQVDPNTIALNAIRTENELPDNDLHKPLKKWEFVDNKKNIPAFIHHLASEISNLLNRNDIQVVDKLKSKLDKDPNNQVIKTRPLKAEDIAVLCRTNVRVHELAVALKGFGIQVAALQDNLIETAEMKLFLAVLNYYMDKNDSLAKITIRLLSEQGMSVSGLIDDRLEFLYRENALARPASHEEENAAEWEAYYQNLNLWGNENILLQKIEKIREQSGHLSVSSLVDRLVTISGISDLVLLWDNPLQRKNNLQAIKKMASDYEIRCLVMDVAASLRGFIESFAYYGNQEISQGAAAGADAVNVMTYHKSKGLEWPIIILTQLDYDHFSDMNFIAKGFFGVNLDSAQDIDLNNPYNGKTIILLPWPYGALNRTTPADLKNRIVMEERYKRQEKNSLRELKRLLYVGMTRARDVMITVSYNQQEMKWANHLTGFDHKNPDLQHNFWGTPDEILTQDLNYGDNDDYPQIGIKPVFILQKNGPLPQDSPMYRSPSKALPIADIKFDLATDFSFRIQLGAGLKQRENELGDCLHEAFYLFRPDTDRQLNIKTMSEVIDRHGLTGELPMPDHVVTSIYNLYDFLRTVYGNPVKVYRELPLQQFKNGIVYKGEADLVWETKNGLILIDYKSYPGSIGNITNPAHEKFSGKYSGQLARYKEMIDNSHPEGKKVIATLIYYAVFGAIVQLHL